MQPGVSVERIEREGADVSPSGESVEQALNARNAVDYANDRGVRGWGGNRGWGWGGPIPRF